MSLKLSMMVAASARVSPPTCERGYDSDVILQDMEAKYGVAIRCDRTAGSYLGFVQIAPIRLWIRYFVKTP